MNNRWKNLLTPTPEGLYCPAGDFHIDPWRPVKRAVITHGHSDHARFGSDQYLASSLSVPILRSRLGTNIQVLGLRYRETIRIGHAVVSLYPAGHILGSAQVRIEVGSQVAVVSGDYKRNPDATCDDFELVPCQLLVTESTFGLPVYRWASDDVLREQINHWWSENVKSNRPSILYGYALGKSQRLLSFLDPSIGPIYIHGALGTPTRIYREQGIRLPETKFVREAESSYKWNNAIILAVPSAHRTPWTRRFANASTALASGWMQIRGQRRRRYMDRGFVVSDHSDWNGLISTVKEAGAEEVWATHGSTDVLCRYLSEIGIKAQALKTEFGQEHDEVALESDPDVEDSRT